MTSDNLETLLADAIERGDKAAVKDLIDAHGERAVASLIYEWADGSWVHPNDSVTEGFAWVTFGDPSEGEALVAQWDNYGFDTIYYDTIAECEAEAAAREAEWSDE